MGTDPYAKKMFPWVGKFGREEGAFSKTYARIQAQTGVSAEKGGVERNRFNKRGY